MSIKTQGTKIFFVSGAAVKSMSAPTGVSGLGGGNRDQIETTTLDDTEDKTYESGLRNPNQVSVPFVFKPTEMSHQELLDLHDSGANTNWMVGLSDGTAAPTIVSGKLSMEATRTAVSFDAYVADVAIEIATKDVVRGTLTLQRTGSPAWTFKG